ncbi:MAG: UvrD-helicase domain-containing protein [Alistipes sp.]|nr:UvrD-helicase domain-containing protein [Alistipes sp.]
MESKESKILEGLNEAQRAAVIDYESPSLIIAGAGSGKTRVLTSRIAYMIEQGVAPFNILALTFTNKAAEQMRERIEGMIGGRSRYIRMGTFHSVFSRILRENCDLIGFPPTFTIYEPSDVKNLIKTIVRELKLDDKKYTPNAIASRISYAKNCLITAAAYAGNASYAAEDRQKQVPEFGNIYDIYCQRCKRNGAMDFDDLLLQTNILLRDRPEVLARYQELFRYILVDEYQDTNYAQYVIIRRLSQNHSRVCVVGDDAQSIYSFRGAKIENILSFKRDYPDAKIFKLEQNYRSTRTIVEAANSVIVHNSKRMEKNCFSEGDKGAPVRLFRAYTDREEAETVVSDLRDKVRAAGAEWSEAAILYRTNNQSLVLEEALRRKGIPYRIYKGNSFYDHKEIRDMLAYLRLIINPRDDEAFKRIVNYPARGIGDTTVERIAQLAAEQGVSMWEAVDTLVAETAAAPAQDAVKKAIARKAADFVGMIRSLLLLRVEKELYDFGMEVAARSGLLGTLRAENTPEAQSAVDNIEELLNTMQLFKEQRDAEIRNGERETDDKATIEEWLQNVMLTTDMDNDDPDDKHKVTLMTVHSAKGLEYGYVYVVGMEENLFPSLRAMETVDGLEEERRLFYVALTRAKCEATLSFAEMRFKWGNMEFSHPSRFLGEIDPKYVEADFDLEVLKARPAASANDDDDGKGAAIDELRRRFDIRYQQKSQNDTGAGFRQGGSASGFQPRGQRQGFATKGAGGYGSGRFGAQNRSGYNGPAGTGYGNSGSASDGFGGYGHTSRNFGGERKGGGMPSYGGRPVVAPPKTSADGMRSVGIRRAASASAAEGGTANDGIAASQAVSNCGYAVGDRVEHPKFGVGIINRIEVLAADCKLIVEFSGFGEKTLLAKFAKLKKL